LTREADALDATMKPTPLAEPKPATPLVEPKPRRLREASSLESVCGARGDRASARASCGRGAVDGRCGGESTSGTRTAAPDGARRPAVEGRCVAAGAVLL
jgi:hypothetical protein